MDDPTRFSIEPFFSFIMRFILACIKELQLITFPKKYHFKTSNLSKKAEDHDSYLSFSSAF